MLLNIIYIPILHILGTLIEPGKIGIASHNGFIYVIPPGRWLFLNPRASLVQVVSLSENVIRYETLSIIRVQR